MASLVKKFAGRSVRINFEDGLEHQGDFVLAELEQEHAAGMALRDGLRIRFGWSFLILQERGARATPVSTTILSSR